MGAANFKNAGKWKLLDRRKMLIMPKECNDERTYALKSINAKKLL